MSGLEGNLEQGFSYVSGPSPHSLILGSAPGKESLARQQYYGYPHNRFWKLLGECLNFDYQMSYQQRLEALIAQGFALWDVIGAFVRPGSLDSSFVEMKANNFQEFFDSHPSIGRVAFNGKKAKEVFERQVRPDLDLQRNLEYVYLPSTSPANATWSYERLLGIWQPWLSHPS